MLRNLTMTLALAAALLLSACSVGSDEPFIAETEIVPGLIEGDYQRYVLTDPEDLPQRHDCITPGYTFQDPDDRAAPVIHPAYCASDQEQRLPVVQVARHGADYRMVGADQELTFRFQRLRDGIYLMQMDTGPGEGLRYGYALAREGPGGVDLAPLACGDFPSLEPVVNNVIEASDVPPEPEPQAEPTADVPDAPAEAPPRARDPLLQTASRCKAPSLAAIQPELDAVVDRMARGRDPMWILLRRVPAKARP